jgi:hypothetical protein
LDRWTDRWMDREMDGQMNRQGYGQIDGSARFADGRYTESLMENVWIDGLKKQMDKQMDGWTDRQLENA